MRISIFLVVFTCLQSFAIDNYAQSKKIDMRIEQASIVKVLEKIEHESEFFFFYNSNVVDRLDKSISFDIKDKTINELLDMIFNGTNVEYTINNRQIILSLKNQSNSISQQQKSISGKITDSTGGSLPGVSVVVKGTTNGTITDAGGNYTLSNIPTEATLQFSFVGMKTQELAVGRKTIINVALIEETIGVEEVVVTALGIKRSEKSLGYSIQKVAGESLQKVSGMDLATSLTGKVAGVLVRNSQDFAAVPVITVRGENALIVIDGVAYQNKTLSDISSEDIESMSVLKGATASALYGFRGANGAILVTTKNGSASKSELAIDLSTNTMFTAGFLAIPEVQSVYGRGDNGVYDQYSDNSWGPKMDGTERRQWDPISKTNTMRPYLPVGKDNFKNFLEQGFVTNNNLNIGYKKDNLSIRNSFNWTENKGRYPNSKLDKYTYAFGADLNVDKFKISTNFSYARKSSPNIGANNYTSYDRMYSILIWSPTDWKLSDYKNNYWITPDVLQQNHFGLNAAGGNAGRDENNPYFDSYEKINKISRDIFNADVTTSYQFTDWLKATFRTGVDFYKEIGEVKLSKGSVLFTGGVPVPGNGGVWNGRLVGSYNLGQNTGTSINSDFLLSGDKKITEDFNVEYLAGGTIFFRRDNNINGGTNNGISVPGFFSLAASVGPATVGQSTQAQQVNSVFGRVGFSWKKLAFVEATGRNDWSSTLAKDQQSYFYPSVAASFVVSELLPNTENWLDLLKLRGSWTLSKRPASIYEINSSYSVSAATWGTLNGAGVPGNLYSPTIAPTSSETYEQGLQAMFLKNRFMVDVSHYSKRTFDRITTVGLTQASGYGGLVTNTKEEITRRGWEVVLNGTAVKNKDWQLNIGFNWSTFASYYTTLDPAYSVVKPWVKVGERADHFISRDFLRDPSGNIIHNGSGRPIVHGYDVLFGYRDPKFIWGTNANLSYKSFSLFVSLDGVNGGLANTRTESYMWQAGVHPNSLTPERESDVATPGSNNYLGQGVKVVSGTATFDPNGNILTDTRVFAPNDVKTTYKNYIFDLHNSSAWGGNGSKADTYSRTFFKLREISLTYNVPTRLLHNVAKGVSISLIGQNVLLKAKQFKYSDPDGGNEDFTDPSTRYLGAKLNFTF